MSNNAILIEKIINLLDDDYLVFIQRNTGKIVAIPEFDDFMDFGDDNYELLLNEVEDNTSQYYQIKCFSSRELFNCMMDFAQEQEDVEQTKVLVKALRQNKGINHFKETLNFLGSQAYGRWNEYYNEQLRYTIKDKLCREKLRFP